MHYAIGPYVLDTERLSEPCWAPPPGAVGIDLRSIPDHAAPGFGLFWSASPFGQEYRSLGQGDIRDLRWKAGERAIFASALGRRTVQGDGLLDGLWDVLTVSGDPTGDDRCKPLMPTRRKHLDLVLSGHGRVRRANFDPGMAEAAPIRDALQRQYRAYRQAARDGLMKDDVHHRRILDMWHEKYGLDEDYFIPDDLPRETRIKHETTIGDTFTDTNGTNIEDHTATGPNSGFSWSTVGTATTFTVESNEINNSGSGVTLVRADSDLSGDDHYAEATFTTAGSVSRTMGPSARKDSSATATYYVCFMDEAGGGDNWETYKRVSGSFTSIGSDTSGSLAGTETLRIECDGSSIKRIVDSSEQNDATDTAISGNVRCGISTAHGASTGLAMDDFEAADLGAGGATSAYYYHMQQ